MFCVSVQLNVAKWWKTYCRFADVAAALNAVRNAIVVAVVVVALDSDAKNALVAMAIERRMNANVVADDLVAISNNGDAAVHRANGDAASQAHQALPTGANKR